MKLALHGGGAEGWHAGPSVKYATLAACQEGANWPFPFTRWVHQFTLEFEW